MESQSEASTTGSTIKVWHDGIDLGTALRDEVRSFTTFKIKQYSNARMTDDALWDAFRDEFQDFTIETFNSLGRTDQHTLRHFLRCAGVYVCSNTPRITIARTFEMLLQEEEQHIWTKDDIRECHRDLSQGPITSVYITATGTKYPYSNPSKSTSPEPATSPTRATDKTPGYSKQVSEVSKIYPEEQKYDGSNGSFDHKLTVFTDICERVELPVGAYLRAFPAMLKGLALHHFYDNQLSKKTFGEVCANFRAFFEGPTFYRRNLDVWNSTSLASISAENTGKSTYQNVQSLVNTLRQMQYGLLPEFRTTAFLHNKIITACQGSPACRYAISEPPPDLGNLINKLQSSITTYEAELAASPSPESFYTDRRFNLPGQGNRFATSRPNQSRTNSQQRSTGICFVCKKPGCRSWKHTQQERDDSKARYMARATRNSATGSIKPNLQRKFDEIYNQYVVDYEGDSDDSLDDALGSLLIDESLADTPNTTDTDTQPESFFFQSCGTLSLPVAAKVTKSFLNQALLHQLTPLYDQLRPPEQKDAGTGPAELAGIDIYAAEVIERYGPHKFQGILIDTGAATHSTAGVHQLQALQKLLPSLGMDTSAQSITIKFGVGSATSIGAINISTPAGTMTFYIMPTATPFLLCLADMDRMKMYVNNLTNQLVTPTGSVPVIRRFGHLFLVWDTALENFLTESVECFLTATELSRLHRRFGHPSVDRLHRVLERAGHDVDKQALKHLSKYCEHCQRYGKAPGRFRFNLRDDTNFNSSIIVDVCYLNGNQPVLHIVDEATRYQAGRFLPNMTAKTVWETLRMCWIDTYLGPPDQITADAGRNFVSQEFGQLAATVGTKIKIVPVEAHHSIGIVERYHGPLRRAFNIINAEIPGISRDNALQMALKAINDSAGPNGIVPTLLVYGAYPRMSNLDSPSPTTAQRATAIRKAMNEVRKLQAKQLVADALNTRNGPNTDAVHALPLNSPVLVWREPGKWKGPYRLLAVDGEDCTLELPHGHSTFRTTSVKPYHLDASKRDNPGRSTAQANPSTIRNGTRSKTLVKRSNIAVEIPYFNPTAAPDFTRRAEEINSTDKRPADIRIFLQDEPPKCLVQDNQFKNSRHKEVIGLLDKGVFELALPSDIPPGTRIFKARFVDEIKHSGTMQAVEKSRLVVQAYNDHEKYTVLTQSPTIQRVSQRIILALAPTLANEGITLHLRDISQAYVQSTTTLNRDFYIRPPIELTKQMGVAPNSTFRVVKPLYGVPEAGNHWFKTYHSHHLEQLKMQQSTYDTCLLHCNSPDFAIVGLQTDDTLILAHPNFLDKERVELQKAGFLAKEREQLSTSTDLTFNGCVIHMDDKDITLTQTRQCKNLRLITDQPVDSTSSRGVTRSKLSLHDQYVAQRARGAYIASVCQPEASYDLSVAAQAIQATNGDIKALNKRLAWQIESPSRGLRFVQLDKASLRLIAFTDASFANNKDLSSQMGYILVLADSKSNANILHWSSIKCKRVTRSVLASELYGMAHGFDIAAAIKSTIERILQINLPLVICTDSKSLYDCLVKLGTTQEKRLMIDVMCLRQAYERREIAEVIWIEGNTNPADSMTKAKPSGALKLLIDSNKVQLNEKQWVDRADNSAKASAKA